jgi:hypothetical protein
VVSGIQVADFLGKSKNVLEIVKVSKPMLKGASKVLTHHLGKGFLKKIGSAVKGVSGAAGAAGRYLLPAAQIAEVGLTAIEVWQYPGGVEEATLAYSLVGWMTADGRTWERNGNILGVSLLLTGDTFMDSYFDFDLFYAAANITPLNTQAKDGWHKLLRVGQRSELLQDKLMEYFRKD